MKEVLKSIVVVLVTMLSTPAVVANGEEEWWVDWDRPKTAMYLEQQRFDAQNSALVREFAECVVANDREGSVTLVGKSFGSIDQVEFAVEELMGGQMYECLSLPRRLRINPTEFLQMITYWLIASGQDPTEHLAEGRNPLEQYGLCLLNDAGQAVSNFLQARPNSDPENEAYKDLFEVASECEHYVDGRRVGSASLRSLLVVVSFNARALPGIAFGGTE